jgi:histidine triad (HIT) family protein
VLVISKTSKARNLLDAEPKTLGRIIGGVQKVARAVKAALNPDGIVVTQFNGAPAGQTVFHLHVHIIPRWEGVPLGRHAEGMADVDELKALAAQISAALEA